MSNTQASTDELKQQVFGRHRKSTKRFVGGPKTTTIAAYTGVFLLIMSMVAIGYQPPQKMDSVANAVSPQAATPTATDQPSVDQLVATNVAAGIAERAELPIAANVANLSLSLSAQSQLAQQTEANVISKPQIVQPTADTREIRHYVAKAGDTVPEVAKRFGVSPTTIKWANDLDTDALAKGRKITIPPVDGVIYTVQSGDTIGSIASKFKADKQRLVTFNDLELGGLTKGKKIIIPGGDLPARDRPGYQAPSQGGSYTTGYSAGYYGSFAGGSVGNRYAAGNCTWYAYERRMELGRPIGSFWGNAATWAIAAQQNGFRVDNTPEVGAIVQWNPYADGSGYFGHVGIVESVNGDGTITISEMNNAAYGGYGVINKRTISPSGVSNFIH